MGVEKRIVKPKVKTLACEVYIQLPVSIEMIGSYLIELITSAIYQNQRSKRALEEREPKAIENTKTAIFVSSLLSSFC